MNLSKPSIEKSGCTKRIIMRWVDMLRVYTCEFLKAFRMSFSNWMLLANMQPTCTYCKISHIKRFFSNLLLGTNTVAENKRQSCTRRMARTSSGVYPRETAGSLRQDVPGLVPWRGRLSCYLSLKGVLAINLLTLCVNYEFPTIIQKLAKSVLARSQIFIRNDQRRGEKS